MPIATPVTLSGPSGARVKGGYFAAAALAVLTGSVAAGDALASGGLGSAAPPPPPAPTGNITQYLTSDGGTASDSGNLSAPTRDYWHKRMGFRWPREYASGNALYGRGNWRDSAQAAEGATPFASTGAAATVGQTLSATVTSLVQRWLSTGANKGFYLNCRSSAWPLDLYGRGNATDANRPKLTLVTSLGTIVLTAVANATWNSSSFTGGGSKNAFRLVTNTQPAILRFDLSAVLGTVSSATLSMVVSAFTSGNTGHIVDVFECDPPTIIVPENPASPVLGISNTYATFNALKASGNAALIAADDFELGGPFDGGFTPSATRTLNTVTGTTYARGEITAGALGSANSRLEISSGTGPQGIPNVVREEAFGQYHLYLESDFGTTADTAIKIPAMGVQFGYWNPAGYWQQTTGNGGNPGTGLKVDRGGGLNFEYQGHSVRFLTGVSPTALDDDPYTGWFGIGIYDYNLDQGGPFPAGASFPMIAIRKERWYCFDIRIKQNTMAGAQDALGNFATANPDGIYQVWINGVAAYSRTNYRWRKHAEFGVQGMWIDVYHGGVDPAPSTMHYRVDRVALATSFIGPRTMMPLWRQGRAALTWGAIGSSVAEDVDPENSALINPNHPAIAPWRSSNGGGDIFRVWNAWCSGAWMEETGDLLVHGGGHDDYAGNEVYKENLYADVPAFVLARKPTGAIGNTGVLDDLGENTGVYFDGRPRSSHTYDNLLNVNGVMWLLSVAGPYRSGQGAGIKTFRFEPNDDWSLVQSGTWPGGNNTANAGSGCHDTLRNRIYYWPSGNLNISYWDVAAGVPGTVTFSTNFGRQSKAIYIPELDIQVCLSPMYAQHIGIYDYGRTAGVSVFNPGATGPIPVYANYAGWEVGWIYSNGVWVPGFGGGVGAILCWHGGTSFNVLTPPAVGNPATTPWAWSTLAAAGSNAVNPGIPNNLGVYGRLFYSRRLKGIGLNLQPNLPTYFFALE